jgi:hypothetical protein
MTEQEAAILAFEARWWRYAGHKEQAIRDELGLWPTRYYQLLVRLLDNPEALAADPVLVNRLRRIRSSGQRRRGQQVA